MSKEKNITRSSGNVFADLGLPESDQLLAKADLALEIIEIIEDRDLTQAEAAEIMGVDQPKVSALVRGRLDGFSMERLYRFLNSLERDVEIIVRPTPKTRKSPSLTVTRKSATRRTRRSPKSPGKA
jgi:predicted XRE-type DNA-binding protein